MIVGELNTFCQDILNVSILSLTVKHHRRLCKTLYAPIFYLCQLCFFLSRNIVILWNNFCPDILSVSALSLFSKIVDLDSKIKHFLPVSTLSLFVKNHCRSVKHFTSDILPVPDLFSSIIVIRKKFSMPRHVTCVIFVEDHRSRAKHLMPVHFVCMSLSVKDYHCTVQGFMTYFICVSFVSHCQGLSLLG